MRLLLLCAPAFSGKTTLSLALEARGWLRVSSDAILRDRGFEPGQWLPVELWQEASLTACSLIAAAAQRGQDVVFDDTLCFRFLRDRYREVGAQAGMSVVLVVLMISPAEVRARVRRNRGSKLREDIEDDLLETHLASFEWPSADEPHIQLDAGQSVAQQLRVLSQSATPSPRSSQARGSS
jgi:gluconate kinase